MPSVINIPSTKLSNGMQIPLVGLGTYDALNEQELIDAVRAAIDVGYRYFDCAYLYNNEKVIGKAIRDAIEQSNGSLKREDFFILSKLWNTFHAKDQVPIGCQKSLDLFGFDYIDLYLIHWPVGFKV